MKKIIALILLGIISISAATMPAFAGGKLAGKVVDSQTKEPLIGATVMVLGTNKGASTSAEGEFVILNIDPGTYKVKVTYVGYNETVLENIMISANLTRTLDVEMNSTAFTTTTFTVVAKKDLINTNVTNSNAILSKADLENMPIRDVQAVVATQTGVVRQNGNLYVRGSRVDAVGFFVDGVAVTDPLFGGSNSSVINSAIEEIQFQSGGYTAEWGGANGGIISTTLKSGGENYKFSFEGMTDNFVTSNDDRAMLGGYSYGYSEYSATVGGPIIPGDKRFRFFVAGSNTFQRATDRFYKGIDMKGIFDPSAGARADTLNLYYPDGIVQNSSKSTYQLQGSLTADLYPVILKFSGTYQQEEWRGGAGLSNMFNISRVSLNERYLSTGNLKVTHFLDSKIYYEVNFSYYGDFFRSMDPDLKEDLVGYGDSVKNAKYGYQLAANSSDRAAYNLFGISINRPGTQLASFEKRRNNSVAVKVDFLYQLDKNEIKTGFEFKRWTIRRYALPTPFNLTDQVDRLPDADPKLWYNRLDNYGYDIYGNPTDDDGLFAPKNPQFFGAYIQDKIEFGDLVVNAGLRLDGINTDSKKFKNPNNVAFDANGIIDINEMEDVKPIWQVSPRLGFSFNLTDKAKFHAQYGKFIQQTRLRDIYQGYVVVSDNIKGGLAIQSPVGFGLLPERTTQYDLGFSQQIGENVAFDLTAYYKDITDQVQLRIENALATAQHGGYYVFTNGDFSSTKGFEVKIDVRRIERVSASFNYTYSDARGTGSNPSTAFRAVWQSPTAVPYFPQQVSPLDFNQTHRGALNIDYRFIDEDAPSYLKDFGANFMFQFNSGHNFTKISGFGNARVPQEALNDSQTPWNFQIDLKIDKSFDFMGVKTNIYLLVLNVLNTKNIVNVQPQTGAINNGYLETEEGRVKVASTKLNYGDAVANNYIKLYNTFNNMNSVATTDGNLDPYGTPRQIRLGFKIDY